MRATLGPGSNDHRLIDSMSRIDPPTGAGESPKYARLRDYFLAELDAGRLKPGDSLPPEVQLAELLGVARNTVRQAMADLEREGLIYRRRGKGTFIRADATSRTEDRLNVYALVVPETRGYYSDLQAGLHEASGRLHRQVLVCDTGNAVHRQGDALLQLLDQRVAGVVLVPVTLGSTPAYHVRPLQRAGVPVVLLHRGVPGVSAPTLRIPFRQVGLAAGQRLARLGHRRVALFAPNRYEASLAYEAGLREAIEHNGGRLLPGNIFIAGSGNPDPAEIEPEVDAQLEQLLALPRRERPTAIMASFDTIAELLYLSATRHGLNVPGDLSLISFGGARRDTPMTRRLSAITVDEAAAGEKCAHLLDGMGSSRQYPDPDEDQSLPLAFHAGKTLGPPG